MPVSHEPWLAALSVIVAIQGAYVGLGLCVQVASAHGLKRRLLLAGAAMSLAVAIWSMHFVGMLAARLPFPVDYLVFPTLLSFLVCAIVVGGAVFAVSSGPPNGGPPSGGRLAAASVFMGGGIASMHYIGMAALHDSAHMTQAPALVAASVVVGVATSGLALWLAGGREGRPPLLLSATALGMAIASMHYTAMAGVSVSPHLTAPSHAPALSSDLLAIVVAVVAFLISGVFLLTLVPESAPRAANDRSVESGGGQVAPPADLPRPRLDGPLSGGAMGLGTFQPLGGAGSPPRRLARQLPVEHGGATYFIPVERIVAVHASAHYTTVFDGKAAMFCPLAIGEVEHRLDERRFARVHRSHIIAIERVTGLKRAGDNGVVELDAEPSLTPYPVPVSRSRLGALKMRLRTRAETSVPTHRFAAKAPEGHRTVPYRVGPQG